MNKELWEYNKTAKLDYDNDANDYYYKWLVIEDNEDFSRVENLLTKFLDYGKIRIKARKGAIFIVQEEDKDDTENPNK